MNLRNFFADLKRRSLISALARVQLLIDPLLRVLRDDARYNNLLAKAVLPTVS